jgi:hypothetical protein
MSCIPAVKQFCDAPEDNDAPPAAFGSAGGARRVYLDEVLQLVHRCLSVPRADGVNPYTTVAQIPHFPFSAAPV